MGWSPLLRSTRVEKEEEEAEEEEEEEEERWARTERTNTDITHAVTNWPHVQEYHSICWCSFNSKYKIHG